MFHRSIALVSCCLVAWLAGCNSDTGPVTSSKTKYEVGEESSSAGSSSSGVGAATRSGSEPRSSDSASPSGSPDGTPTRPRTLAQNDGQGQRPTAAVGNTEQNSSAQLLTALRQLKTQQPTGVTEPELVANFISIQQQLSQVADALLKQDSSEDVLMEAAQAKISALSVMLSQQIDGADEQLYQFAESLKERPQASLAQLGRQIAFSSLMNAFASDQIRDPQRVMDAFKELVQTQPKNEELMGYGQRVATFFVQKDLSKEGAELLRFLADAYQDTPDPRLVEGRQSLLEQARFADVNLGAKLRAVEAGEPEALDAWSAALQELVTGDPVGFTTLRNLIQLAGGLEPNQPEVAARIYEAIRHGFAQHSDTQLAEIANDSLDRFRRRTEVMGHPFVVEGVLPDGKPFDWTAYQGKVVLVDFWATWCEPCLRELPNIRKNFDQYHAHGFEVVGINIDNNPEDFHRFMALHALPWPNVLSTDPNGEHPMVARYGIESIPFLVIVGRDGMAVAVNLRGEQLDRKLAELFPEVKVSDEAAPATETAPAANANSQWFPATERELVFVSLTEDAAAVVEESERPEELHLTDVNPYTPPPGLTAAELVEFIFKMQDKPQTIQRREGFAAALVEAADRILAGDANTRQRQIAVTTKLETLHRRAVDGDEAADVALRQFLAQLDAQPQVQAAEQLEFFRLEQRVLAASELAIEELPGLLADIQAFLQDKPLHTRHLRLASATVAAINRLQDAQQRERYFQDFGGLFAKSQDKELASYGRRVAGSKPQSVLELVGRPLEIAGVTTAGEALDWSSYRGRVVLIDFWATWCGPCQRELPHLKALYNELHERGLEVIAVSLDRDLEALGKYLQDNEIAWPNLAGPEAAELAKQHGIVAIPTLLVVNPQGKVAALGHDVNALRDEIEQLLPRAS